MFKILISSGLIIFGLSSIIFLVKHTIALNSFLSLLRVDFSEKWNELGGLKKHGMSFNNKRARYHIDRWIKNETDEKYAKLKAFYSRVSRYELRAAISIVITTVLFILQEYYKGKL